MEINLNHVLNLWAMPANTDIVLINVSENRTYLITEPNGRRSVLREHRPHYHTKQAIQSELMWIESLRTDSHISVPVVIPGQNGTAIQTVQSIDTQSLRHLVLFQFLEGIEPADDKNILQHFETLGSIAACMHLHAIQWPRPANFTRREWNIETVLGELAEWGHWRSGPGINQNNLPVLSKLEQVLRSRLSALGMSDDVYGLIHADMRRANLLLSNDETHVIDFDDCGFSWYLYDFATAVSFMENHPQMDDLKKHWLLGYRRHRPLSKAHAQELDTLILFRRLALLGWMGTHPEVDIVKELSSEFAQNSATMAHKYLISLGSAN